MANEEVIREVETDVSSAWERLQELYDAKEVIEVEISGIVNKGVIAVVEGVRGFIPESRLTLGKISDLNDWLGKKVRVRIITVDEETNRLVLSAREVKREERDSAKQEKIDAIKVGEIFDGKVDNIQDYGAFIDLGNGLSGLVHISQISLKHLDHPSDELSVGQEVKVKVIGKQNGKLKLSIKALLEQEKKERQKAERVVMPKAEDIGTSLGDLLKDVDLQG